MAYDFKNDVAASTYDADANLQEAQTNRAAQRSGFASTIVSGAYDVTSGIAGAIGNVANELGIGGIGTSVVGLKTSEIGSMTAAIELYCANIMSYLNGLNPAADSETAFKGPQVKEALEQYMRQVQTYCSRLTSQLQSFSDKLNDVANQWNEYARGLAGNINTASGDYAVGEDYKTEVRYNG